MSPIEPKEDPSAPTPSARTLLVDWANNQDGWVRRLVLEVLASGKPVSPEVINDVYSHFLDEKGLGDEPAPVVPPLEHQESPGDVSGALLFRKLENVRGVNALVEGQEIAFNPGLTVLFGENGTGKTGYARILKTLVGERTAEQILPNVHEPGAVVSPEASIVYSIGDDEHALEWRGEVGAPPITHVSVFDSPAVRLHVDEDLAWVFTPRDLALFHTVSENIDAIKAKADEAAAGRRVSSNPFLTLFARGTAVYTHIETLGPATDLSALQALAVVTEEEEKDAGLLRTSVSALQSDSIQAQLTAARGRVQLYEDLERAAAAAAAFDAEAFNQAVSAAKEAADAYAVLRTELLASAGITDGSEEAWQEFILKGDAYRAHLEPDHSAQEGEPCPYCRQPLTSDAAALLLRYHKFATDAARQRIEDAQAQANVLTRQLATLNRDALGALVERHRQDDLEDQGLADAVSMLVALNGQAPKWEGLEVVDWSGLTTTSRSVEKEASARRAAAEVLVTDLTTRSANRAERLRDDSAKLAEIDGRIELKKRLPEIEKSAADAKWVQRLGQLVRGFPALKHSLTEVSKTASEQLLNADFERRFAQECKVLRAPEVRLEFPGRQGKPARRKVVSAEHRPSQILSEGEQKVIALADFLAEAALRVAPAPVIFDDPVNSLDYRRIHEVAKRIGQLAEARQVIVFTHSIWLATELLAHFDKTRARCTYYSVTDEGGKGVVVPGTHPRWDTVKNTGKKINELIAAAKSAQGDVREAIVETAYSRIRSWCEVVAETELLQGVTQRYQANVMMTMLPKIRGDRLTAATEVIYPIFEKACRMMEGHSQPLETLSIRPTVEELEKDWAAAQAARDAYNA